MNRFPEVLFMLKREHLTEEQQELFDCLGHDAYCNLLRQYGGTRVNVPKIKSVRLLLRDYIARFYTVENKRELIRFLGIDQRYFQRLLLKSYSVKKSKASLQQI